jgi:hypothetical protein
MPMPKQVLHNLTYRAHFSQISTDKEIVFVFENLFQLHSILLSYITNPNVSHRLYFSIMISSNNCLKKTVIPRLHGLAKQRFATYMILLHHSSKGTIQCKQFSDYKLKKANSLY